MASKGGKVAGGAASGAAAGASFGPWGALAGGVIGGGIGLMQPDDVDPGQYLDQIQKLYENQETPDLSKAIALQQYLQGGQLSPEQLSKLQEEYAPVNQIEENPELIQKQKLLGSLYEQLSQTGMGPQERLELEQARINSSGDAQARNASLMQKFQQMGQGPTSGASLAAQLSSNQAADQDSYMQNLQAAASAAENRQRALANYASQLQGMRGQDAAVASANVNAKNQARNFDIQNSMARQNQNAANRTNANVFNLNNQNVTNKLNTQQYNQEQLRQKWEAPQQMFNNEMQLLGARSGALMQQANQANNNNQANAQNFASIMSGLNQAGQGIGQYYNNKTPSGNNNATGSAGTPGYDSSGKGMLGGNYKF